MRLKYFTSLSVLIALCGCAAYGPLKHSDTPYHTHGTYSIFKSIGKVIRKKYAGNGAHQAPYIVNSTMRASEFMDTSAIYQDKLVSYSARIESEDTDIIRLMWDDQPGHFGTSAPAPLLFPYPHDGNHINNRYYMKFVPVAAFQKAKPAHVWDNANLIDGLKFKDVLYQSKSYIEKAGGFISTNYPKLYYNNFSSLGVIHEMHMTNGEVIKCYLITSDLYDDASPRYVRWKVKY